MNGKKSYLLRLWPQQTATQTKWRFSLQSVPNGPRLGFADLIELMLYLEALTPVQSNHLSKPINTRSTKMTPQQITLVKQSFAQVEPIADQAAKLFYDRLFAIAPEVAPLFAHTDMRRQRQTLMATLGMVVHNLDKADVLLPAVINLGARHQQYGVRPHHYTAVGDALLWTLAQGLGDAFTNDVRAAWVEAYTLLAEIMQDAAEAAIPA